MGLQAMTFPQLENIEDQQKLFDLLKLCSMSKTRIAAERDLMSENLKKISKEIGIDKKLLSKLATVYHKQNYDEEVACNEQFEMLYNIIVK